MNVVKNFQKVEHKKVWVYAKNAFLTYCFVGATNKQLPC